MKKFFVTILALVYLTVSSGATVNLHYCMGKLMSWDLSHDSKGKCGSCGMEKSGHKGCCNDQQKVLKVDKDQKADTNPFQFLFVAYTAQPVIYSELPLAPPVQLQWDTPGAHAPPVNGRIPLFIRHRNFRI